jgi:hypothetical protein
VYDDNLKIDKLKTKVMRKLMIALGVGLIFTLTSCDETGGPIELPQQSLSYYKYNALQDTVFNSIVIPSENKNKVLIKTIAPNGGEIVSEALITSDSFLMRVSLGEYLIIVIVCFIAGGVIGASTLKL